MEKNNGVVSIKKIGSNIAIKNEQGKGLFLSSRNSLIISIANLAVLIRFLVLNDFLSPRVLEGILEEYNSFKFELSNYIEGE